VLGYRLFFLFSPEGVRRLYALPEEEASFVLATFTLVFKHKIPLEQATGRRIRPHDLFGGQEVEGYLADLENAVARQLAALGPRAPSSDAAPPPRQLGAVARAARPCPVRYRARRRER